MFLLILLPVAIFVFYCMYLIFKMLYDTSEHKEHADKRKRKKQWAKQRAKNPPKPYKPMTPEERTKAEALAKTVDIALEKRLQEEKNPLTKCKACGKSISKNAVTCPHCGEPIKTVVTPQPSLNSFVSEVPKCPVCSSANIGKISLTKKAGSVAMFGTLSAGYINKTYKCKNCGAKF